MRLFRSMKEDKDGLPTVGPGGRLLGVRPAGSPTPDVPVASPSDLLLPGQGGMSVVPADPMHLPRHHRPAGLGGTGRDPVWSLETEDLGPELQFRQDRPTHGLIEPQRAMTLRDYQDALAQTRVRWRLHCR
jgi:hypothetical protein